MSITWYSSPQIPNIRARKYSPWPIFCSLFINLLACLNVSNSIFLTLDGKYSEVIVYVSAISISKIKTKSNLWVTAIDVHITSAANFKLARLEILRTTIFFSSSVKHPSLIALFCSFWIASRSLMLCEYEFPDPSFSKIVIPFPRLVALPSLIERALTSASKDLLPLCRLEIPILFKLSSYGVLRRSTTSLASSFKSSTCWTENDNLG